MTLPFLNLLPPNASDPSLALSLAAIPPQQTSPLQLISRPLLHPNCHFHPPIFLFILLGRIPLPLLTPTIPPLLFQFFPLPFPTLLDSPAEPLPEPPPVIVRRPGIAPLAFLPYLTQVPILFFFFVDR